jgi:hypothetical protein
MLELIQRGQDSGDIDATLPPAWLLTVGLALGRAVGEAVRAGRMTIEESAQAMHHGFFRLLGVADPAAPGPLSTVRPGNAANPRAFLRQAARATVRSEKILPNGPWFVLSLTVAGLLGFLCHPSVPVLTIPAEGILGSAAG